MVSYSARSLSVSHTPTAGSIPAQRTLTSDAEQQGLKEPLLGEVKPMPSASSPKPKTLLCVEIRVSTQGAVAAESNRIGSFLGWGMTAIYLVGRLPQISLNFFLSRR
ncbi:uncharacterized protein [Primulina huaijiensis]|uniref:uncharacterized protein isoform X2 n=1 Tax=Primulina huaijiensis TaxID=1492673 RepID=UPI003CC7771A